MASIGEALMASISDAGIARRPGSAESRRRSNNHNPNAGDGSNGQQQEWDIVFSFDSSGCCYFLDFKQVVSISSWRQEQGCKICKEYSDASAGGEMDNTCACQLLPSYVTVRLKHVNLIIYSMNQSNSQIFGVMEALSKAFEEERALVCEGTEKGGPTPSVSELPDSLSTAVGSSKTVLQQFLTRLDCMSECAVGAVDVCHADIPQMARRLHVLMEHSAEHRECTIRLKSLQCQLQFFLKALEDEKETHFSTNSRAEEEIGGSHSLDEPDECQQCALIV
ncbi:hypothetical protein GOP47_0016827 [Adiantum capillus-veneris]|uniref:Uncharacterized protein n=1 Tax=Adiantum capillus-veneris TaxID=13818 RepID=A0A9D4ZC27_ADICA|nr:hypothetical protein GOP47_0016827 [Adiantum capillus-veneris]